MVIMSKKSETMFYIYSKNIYTRKSSFFMKTSDRKVAETKIRELNADSLLDDEYYYISESNESGK